MPHGSEAHEGQVIPAGSSQTIDAALVVGGQITANGGVLVKGAGGNSLLSSLATTNQVIDFPDDSGVVALDDVFTSVAKGLAPASGGGTSNFLRADGTWAAPAGGSGLTHPQVLARGLGA